MSHTIVTYAIGLFLIIKIELSEAWPSGLILIEIWPNYNEYFETRYIIIFIIIGVDADPAAAAANICLKEASFF